MLSLLLTGAAPPSETIEVRAVDATYVLPSIALVCPSSLPRGKYKCDAAGFDVRVRRGAIFMGTWREAELGTTYCTRRKTTVRIDLLLRRPFGSSKDCKWGQGEPWPLPQEPEAPTEVKVPTTVETAIEDESQVP